MDLEDGKSYLQLGHSQTAQDHKVSYKHLLEKRINDFYPKEEKNYIFNFRKYVFPFTSTIKKRKEKENTKKSSPWACLKHEMAK